MEQIEKIKNFQGYVLNGEKFFYNPKRKILILETVENLAPINKALSLPKDVIVWISVSLQDEQFTEKIKNLTEKGFEYPYVTLTTPMYTKILPSIALSFPIQKLYIAEYTDTSTKTINEIIDVVEQYKNNSKSCYLYARLTKHAIDFLKKLPELGKNQEVSGTLFVQDVMREKNHGRFIYVIGIDENSIEYGDTENVSVAGTRFNFHSHPLEAYVRHSVDRAWPSITDYLGYHKLGDNTIFHCVATLEGLYVISFSSHWANDIKGVSRRFIDKNFDIDHKENYTPLQYVQKVSSIEYKGFPIFVVKFYKWENASTIFKVFFPQTGSTCLMSQNSKSIYKKMTTNK